MAQLPTVALRGLTKKSTAFFFFLKGKRYTRRSVAGTCLEAFYAIGTNLPQAELKGMFHPCRKSPDTGKANKMKREEALPSFPNSAPTTSHITNLQTNYLEPDILKNFPLQLSEYREIQNRGLGSRLRQGSEFKSLIKANRVCYVVLANTSIIEITPNDLIDLTNTSS